MRVATTPDAALEEHVDGLVPPRVLDRTPSGIVTPLVATPDLVAASAPEAPGLAPFTRGIFADGYRGRLWTFRQYSGFGTAEDTMSAIAFY